MNVKNFLFLYILILVTASCEDVIEIDLNSMSPKLVVEGHITDTSDYALVRLTKTTDYFNPKECPVVDNARLDLTMNNNQKVKLSYIGNGYYRSPSIDILANSKYHLNIETDDEVYSADVEMPQRVVIDSLSIKKSETRHSQVPLYMVLCHFTDPENIENYYRLKAYLINDTTKAAGELFVMDDKFIDGNHTVMPWNLSVFKTGDTVIVELQTLDKSTYDFYYTLAQIAGEARRPPVASSTPANPESNISGNALGYFGAFTVSKDTIIVR